MKTEMEAKCIVNKDWEKLKQSKDGIPTYDSLYPYILLVLKDKSEQTNKQISKAVFEYLHIPSEIIRIKYPKYPEADGILENRFSFALTDLYRAGAIARPRRATYTITEFGIKLLSSKGDELTKDLLKKTPEYIKYEEEMKVRNKSDNILADEVNDEDPIDERIRIIEFSKKVNNEVATELLDKIRNINPYFFEKLVIDLLDTMGYVGPNGNAMVTSKSNDGGIDGIINQDPLGTNTVYVQAKRYKEDNIIQRPDIQGFYGALAGINADRGVFITTSRFSKAATEYAMRQGIVLVDGIQLTDMMLKYKVGVQTHKKIELLKIDEDYFEENTLY
ncbi:restriction system protein [Trichococcus patagoniensis]|uniref:Restriction system protein n=1 Tax=Trichococcus patagoniensis TaxID=382641 RepID=A0A2T5IKZ6_9LACT|nr:restriction system protein [Trichococcus patagoniensis]